MKLIFHREFIFALNEFLAETIHFELFKAKDFD